MNIDIFKKVVIVGPDYRAKGGIATVISCYNHYIPGLSFMKSNSRHGFVFGVINLITLLFKLPFARFSGKEILHIHSASGKSFLRKSIIVSWGRFFGFKIVFHCHGGMMKEYVERVGVRRVKATLGVCDEVIVLSDSWKIWFEETFQLKNIKVLNNSIDVLPSCGDNKIRSGKVRFLFLGEVCGRKGVWDLLEAAKNLKLDLGNRFEVIIGGTGEIDVLRFKIEENCLADIVKSVGWITGKEKIRIIESSDVMLLPSYIEGLPVSLLEGFAFGLPAIATTVGGIPDMVTDGMNGSLIPPGDVSALIAAMRDFIENPAKIDKYSINAVKSFEPYSIIKVRDRLREIYEKVLS